MPSTPALSALNPATEMYPLLTGPQIARVRAFARQRSVEAGEVLYRPGVVAVPVFPFAIGLHGSCAAGWRRREADSKEYDIGKQRDSNRYGCLAGNWSSNRAIYFDVSNSRDVAFIMVQRTSRRSFASMKTSSWLAEAIPRDRLQCSFRSRR
jgi:hypothetical protein